jgi:uncharacterized pyridoxamine 5'-phosphate oxidase family protein
MDNVVDEALGYIEALDVAYLASCVDDQPYVRAMMLIKRNGKYYFATGSTDGKMSQLTRNPKVEVCIPIEDEGSVRLRGEICFITNEETRAEIHGCTGFIQGFWSDPTDPDFVLMEFKPNHLEYMRPGTVEIEKAELG